MMQKDPFMESPGEDAAPAPAPSSKKMILLLGLLAAFPPLSTDMYLPAIPMLRDHWEVTLATANLTLVSFFLSFSLFLLIYGPLSDRCGTTA